MEGMTFFGFAAVVVIGIALLALTLEFLNPERQTVTQENRKPASEGARVAESLVATMPAFFERPQVNQRPLAIPVFDDALLALLQNHVRAERAMAEDFVHFPSIDRLYRQPGLPLTSALTAASGGEGRAFAEVSVPQRNRA